MTSRVRVAIAVGIAVVLAAVAVVAFAAGRRGDSGPRTPLAAPSPSLSGSSEVALATPAPAPSPTVSVRLPDNRGEDPVAAMKEIVRFRDEIFHAPDPELVRYIYSPECTCYDSLRQTVTGFVKRGWHTRGGPADLTDVHLKKRDHFLAWVQYWVEPSTFDVLDADENVVEADSVGERQHLEAVLLLDRTDRWRVQDIRDLGTQ